MKLCRPPQLAPCAGVAHTAAATSARRSDRYTRTCRPSHFDAREARVLRCLPKPASRTRGRGSRGRGPRDGAVVRVVRSSSTTACAASDVRLRRYPGPANGGATLCGHDGTMNAAVDELVRTLSGQIRRAVVYEYDLDRGTARVPRPEPPGTAYLGLAVNTARPSRRLPWLSDERMNEVYSSICKRGQVGRDFFGLLSPRRSRSSWSHLTQKKPKHHNSREKQPGHSKTSAAVRPPHRPRPKPP